MNDEGRLLILSGFAGSGKGTVMNALLERYPSEFALSISATTRAPRSYETDGVQYFFKTRDEFLEMIGQGQLLEYAEYVGNFYGTPKDYVEDKLRSGQSVFLEIERQGALKIKKDFPDALLIFLLPPSIQELENRLIGRGTETPDVIRKRMTQASEEISYISEYDYVIINEDVEESMKQIRQIVDTEKCRSNRNQTMIQELKTQLDEYLKGE